MNIKTIASSSTGCCYVIESGGYQLLIECGVSIQKIREALDFDLSKVVGCLVSHEHGDHSDYLQKLEKETNIPIYCTEGTRKRFGLFACHPLKNRIFFKPVGVFGILPLKLIHDVDCFGFVIQDGNKTLFYATDTASVKYNIPGLTHLMIEANHSFESMIESERNKSVVKRTLETHLDIDSVVEFVKRHPTLEEIHLIHLSDAHSDAEKFKRMVQDVSGCIVKVADK